MMQRPASEAPVRQFIMGLGIKPRQDRSKVSVVTSALPCQTVYIPFRMAAAALLSSDL